MHSKLCPWISLLGLLVAIAPNLAAQPAAAAAPAAASGTQVAGLIKAARVTGTVTATINATKVTSPVTNTSVLAQFSTVNTGNNSSVVLVFSNGATINLGANSELNIEQFTQDPFNTQIGNVNDMKEEPTISTTRIRLNRGELVGKVAHLKTDQGSSFQVATPVGAAGIRGTTFQIVYRPSGDGRTFNFTLTTADGTVVFGTVNAPQVAVSNNQQVNLTGNVNATTGTVTITPPAAGTPAATSGAVVTVVDAPNASIAQVLAQAQVIAQSVAAVVITPVTTTSNGTNSTSNGSGSNGNTNNNTPQASNPAPGPTTPLSNTTPGAGQ
jgi:hypothetical protein